MTNDPKRLLCSRCKVQYYSSIEEQQRDYANHKSFCKKTSKLRNLASQKEVQKNSKQDRICNQLSKILTLANNMIFLPLECMLTSLTLLDCFGPVYKIPSPSSQLPLTSLFQQQHKQQSQPQNNEKIWEIGSSEITLQHLAFGFLTEQHNDNYQPVIKPFRLSSVEPSLLMEHEKYQIPLPSRVLEIHLQTLLQEDFYPDTVTKDFALPHNRPKELSIMDWWAFYCTDKTDLFLISIFSALCKLCDIRAFSFQGKIVKKWSVVEVLKIQDDIVPVSKLFYWKIKQKQYDYFVDKAYEEKQRKEKKRQNQYQNRNLNHNHNKNHHIHIQSKENIQQCYQHREQQQQQFDFYPESESKSIMQKKSSSSISSSNTDTTSHPFDILHNLKELETIPDACNHRMLCLEFNDNSKQYFDFSIAKFYANKNSKVDQLKLNQKELDLFKQAETHIPVLSCSTEEELLEYGFKIKPDSVLLTPPQYLRFIMNKFPETVLGSDVLMRHIIDGFKTNCLSNLTKKEKEAIHVEVKHSPVWTVIQSLLYTTSLKQKDAGVKDMVKDVDKDVVKEDDDDESEDEDLFIRFFNE